MSKHEVPVMQQPFKADEEIDLREVIHTIWGGKWLIMAITLAFSIAGVAYALQKPSIYQASVLLAPTNDEGGLGGIGGQLGGLASLAGISVGRGSSNQTTIALEVLQSRAFLANFIRRHSLEVPLMATKAWNDKSQDWVFNRNVYNSEVSQWLTDENGESFRPTDWDLVKKFKANHLAVSENKDSGMITVSIRSMSPPAAQQWAEWLVGDINEHMRQLDVAKARARITYLENKLEETNVAGMQEVFYQLIERETRTVMLANAQKEYVFETVDPAVVPQEKSEPKRVLIVIVATMLGGISAVFVLFIQAFIRSDRKNDQEGRG